MRLLNWLWKALDGLIAVLTIGMICLVFTNVVLRYGFSSSLRPSVELSRLGLVWVVMMGAVVAMRRDEHLAVTEFSAKLFPRAVPVLRRIGWAITLICVSMLFIGAFRQMQANWGNISQLTGLPSALFYLAGVISGGLMAFVAAVRIFIPTALLPKELDLS
ncbi:2,3-diketo-L-gulonate TRAP transporter small permease protein YiaM [Cognatishimia activa]|uniref:TRAP transporter small permease protein n=1 Tax=Cognatishimia activa TaxID=1715691 RepID=A0A0P1ISR0_9RHOB|nr:TRAP transporter small permease [Cognatishimia activa]CUK26634.1 2,3-diketo-L-gulonate TRAP transporter small permease protein YiaM [Cognatishimia activa]